MSVLDKYGLPLLKAEALCAELLQNDLSFDKIVFKPMGSFRQSFRPDIEYLSGNFDDADGITISVNRDGIYDRLPEGLFHQPRGNSKNISVSDMAAEYKRYRDEEKNARKFFHPLEQEFFRYRVMIEQEERSLGKGIFNSSLQEVFYKFWDIDVLIPGNAAAVLIRIMPWASEIKNNIALTAKALELMLGKPVTGVEKKEALPHHSSTTFSLNDSVLGIETVTGSFFPDLSVNWHFTINDLSSDEIVSFVPGKPYGDFLKRFEDIFIPVEVDAFFDFEVTAAIDNSSENILGYNLTI